jgi:hypothetical protein
MEILAQISQICENYRGHDQLLGLIGYNCTMLSGLCQEKSEKMMKFQKISTEIYNCRTILRFLDSFSMLNYTISYGFGKQVLNQLYRVKF